MTAKPTLSTSGAENEPPVEAGFILGVKLSRLTLDRLLAMIQHSILTGEQVLIEYANIHALNLAYELHWFRDVLNRASVVFCDGFGVKLAAGILGMGAIERFTPPDWFPRLAELCVREGFRLYLLGAQPGTAHQAAASLSQRHPGLNIVGTGHGYFDKRVGSPENQAVLENIRAAKPHILIVGFGMPAQERWISENWDDLTANVILPVGAAIDYLAGSIPRAPAWMTGHGLEWLGRLVIEPRRLWKRYLVGNPLFFWRVFKQRLGLVHFE